MCFPCWDEYGRPGDWNPRIKRGLDLTRTLYETEPTGGPLHAELDDWNIGGRIEADYRPYESGDIHLDPDARAAVEELVPLLDEMTVRERASMLGRYWGYVPTAHDRDRGYYVDEPPAEAGAG